mmetsp:Transcript_16805/g.42919  ORF Transcript_16805/g.42919 Transcript_16805/m.42919 type:complete len:302 (-) Transcript_16805:1381-2286(-)
MPLTAVSTAGVRLTNTCSISSTAPSVSSTSPAPLPSAAAAVAAAAAALPSAAAAAPLPVTAAATAGASSAPSRARLAQTAKGCTKRTGESAACVSSPMPTTSIACSSTRALCSLGTPAAVVSTFALAEARRRRERLGRASPSPSACSVTLSSSMRALPSTELGSLTASDNLVTELAGRSPRFLTTRPRHLLCAAATARAQLSSTRSARGCRSQSNRSAARCAQLLTPGVWQRRTSSAKPLLIGECGQGDFGSMDVAALCAGRSWSRGHSRRTTPASCAAPSPSSPPSSPLPPTPSLLSGDG